MAVVSWCINLLVNRACKDKQRSKAWQQLCQQVDHMCAWAPESCDSSAQHCLFMPCALFAVRPRALQANNVSCVGVISHSQGGGLAASLSSSDLCGLLPEQFAAALSMPVLQYLQAKASAGWGVQQQQQHNGQQPQHMAQQQQQQLPSSLQAQQRQEQSLPGSAHTWGLKVRQVLMLHRQLIAVRACRNAAAGQQLRLNHFASMACLAPLLAVYSLPVVASPCRVVRVRRPLSLCVLVPAAPCVR